MLNAADIVNTSNERMLANIIYKYGEEKNSRKIAKQIVEARKNKEIKTTGALKELITEITPPRYQTKTLSRVFQALRIHVNNELEFLKQFLKNSIEVLKKVLKPYKIKFNGMRLAMKYMGKSSYIYPKPVGVVGIISPWNFPFGIPFSQVVMAVAAGNAAILKPGIFWTWKPWSRRY